MDNAVHWIPIDRIEVLIQLEAYILVGALSFIAWALYRIFLRDVSDARHARLRERFSGLVWSLTASSLFSCAYWLIQKLGTEEVSAWQLKVSAYLGLLGLVFGAIVLVRLAQLFLYVFLFLSHMRVGVPRLIVNFFTVAVSMLIFGWIATNIFAVSLAPILATSAFFSVLLGLGLQDSLGNLFSGVAVQLDRPYRIGDWIEVHHDGQKWLGQVQEITWRATLLQNYMNDRILISNRTMAQSQVTVYTHGQGPVRRSQTIRVPFGVGLDAARGALLKAARETEGVVAEPAPAVLVTEIAESWVKLKVFYSIADFGLQYRVADGVLSRVLAAVAGAELELAVPRLAVTAERVLESELVDG